MQGTQIQSLVKELRSHRPQDNKPEGHNQRNLHAATKTQGSQINILKIKKKKQLEGAAKRKI